MAGYRQAGHHDADHRHQFDEDVERRTGRIFERVAYRVAYNGGFMAIAAFAAEIALFHIFFGVIPRALSG